MSGQIKRIRSNPCSGVTWTMLLDQGRLHHSYWDPKDHRLCFKAHALCSELILKLLSPIRGESLLLWHKKTLWESWFSGKDYKNSSINYKLQACALYFPKQIPSGLSLSVLSSFFLSKMDELPGGIIKKEGLN